MRIRISTAIASHMHRQITSRFAHIGHAAAEAAALPAIAALIYYLRSYQPPRIWQYGKNAHLCDFGKGDFRPFVNI
jgi:hypothetical protein